MSDDNLDRVIRWGAIAGASLVAAGFLLHVLAVTFGW